MMWANGREIDMQNKFLQKKHSIEFNQHNTTDQLLIWYIVACLSLFICVSFFVKMHLLYLKTLAQNVLQVQKNNNHNNKDHWNVSVNKTKIRLKK